MNEHGGRDLPEGRGGLQVSAWAIRNPVPVAVLFLALVVAGVIAYSGLAVKEWPNLNFPLATVTVTENGAAPFSVTETVTSGKVMFGNCFTGRPA